MSTHDFDVIVAGGGSAGIAAAIAAAKSGMRTLLIERNHCLGGASTMRNVITYCGLYTLGEQPELVVGGIGASVLQALQHRKAVTEPLRHRGVYVIFDPESVKTVLDELTHQAGVTVRLGTIITAAKRNETKITSVTVTDHGGSHELTAAAFVDCTGDGDLLFYGAARVRYGNNGAVNLGTLGTRFGGIDPEVVVDAARIATAVAGLPDRSVITKDRSVVARLPISNDLVCYLASEAYDPRDAVSVSNAERTGRAQAWHYLEAIRTIDGCANAYLVSSGPEFGTRESRHVESVRQLTWQDIQRRQTFNDCIGLGAWGAEWHDRETYESSFDYPPEKQSYEIPLSCLTSINTSNLFAAGRLADGDRLAGASIRVMGTAFVTGQACGVAAAVQARGETASAAAVRDVLIGQGAKLKRSD